MKIKLDFIKNPYKYIGRVVFLFSQDQSEFRYIIPNVKNELYGFNVKVLVRLSPESIPILVQEFLFDNDVNGNDYYEVSVINPRFFSIKIDKYSLGNVIETINTLVRPIIIDIELYFSVLFM